MSKIYQILNKYANKYMNTRIVFVFDVLMSVLATLCSVLFVKILYRNDIFSTSVVLLWLLISAAISIIVIRVFKTYRIIIRHMSLTEFTYFVLLAFVKCVLMALIFIAMYGYSFGVVVLIASDFFFSFGAFFALRAMILMIYELFNSKLQEKKKGLNVLVYGVGLKSVSLIPRLKESRHYNIVGFIQFGNVGVSHVISDLKAFYVTSESEFKNVINAAGADALLFADDEDARIEKERIIKYAIASGVKLLFAPAIDEMVDGKPVQNLRNIEIEDLLMRPEIKISMDEIVENFKGKTIMVTGAAGSIGSELCRQLVTFGIEDRKSVV